MRQFLRYTILSILGTLGVSCYILADTFFVSKGLGTNGLAALNLAIPIYNFIYGTGLMLGMGGATKFSICKSQKKAEEGNRIYSNTVMVAVLCAVVFVAIGLIFSEQTARALGADDSVLEMTTIYLRWLMLFAPAFILNSVMLCFVRNDEGPKLSMIAMLTGSMANIVLDYIFIFPCQMGIFGAIFATGLSPVISLIIMSAHWRTKKNSFHFIRTRLNFHMIRQNVALGLPSFIEQVASGIVMILFNVIILKLTGNTGVAAYGVIANISIVVVAMYAGIAQGVQPLFSQYYGQGNGKQVMKMFRYALVTMTIFAAMVYLVVYGFTQPIADIFNSEHHQELQRMAMAGLRIYFSVTILVGFNIILAMFFVSVEKALPAQILSILRGIVLIVPLLLILSAGLGMTGVWLAYPITEAVVAVLGMVLYVSLAKSRKIMI